MSLPPRLRLPLLVPLVIATAFFTLIYYHPTNGTTSFLPNLSDAEKSPNSNQWPVSYDKTTPPSIGCEETVIDLQRKILQTYTEELKGIRYVNIFGYLDDTENKGDAAIWVAQDILLATLGIQTMEICRHMDERCTLETFRKALDDHAPHSAIIMAGGGNFNDFYNNENDDHPYRLQMARAFKNYTLRAFPQSISMTNNERIRETAESFGDGSDVQLAARDQPSFSWLQQTFGAEAKLAEPNKVRHVLTPDIAFMYGSRPDIRLNTPKTHQVYILARNDRESVAEGGQQITEGEGMFDFGVSYLKADWIYDVTPNLDGEIYTSPSGEKITLRNETSPSIRNSLKAQLGFKTLASAEFVITDRLHGHILCTLMGIPHVLLDSKLKKNIFFHDTWTKDCDCTRVAETFEEAKNFARMYFEKKARERR